MAPPEAGRFPIALKPSPILSTADAVQPDPQNRFQEDSPHLQLPLTRRDFLLQQQLLGGDIWPHQTGAQVNQRGTALILTLSAATATEGERASVPSPGPRDEAQGYYCIHPPPPACRRRMRRTRHRQRQQLRRTLADLRQQLQEQGLLLRIEIL
nr:E4 [Equus caballus papillomavirus 10]